MILQVAFERLSDISEGIVAPYIGDPRVQFEFGTPLVTEYGYSQLRQKFDYIPSQKLYVDTKTIDFHASELDRLRWHGFHRCSFLIGSELKALRAIAETALARQRAAVGLPSVETGDPIHRHPLSWRVPAPTKDAR